MTFVVGCLIAAASRDASAQIKPWEDRVYMNVGFGVESGEAAAIRHPTTKVIAILRIVLFSLRKIGLWDNPSLKTLT